MKYVLPEKSVSVSGAVNAETLLKKKEDQILLTETDLAVFKAGSHIVLDFGKEYAGGKKPPVGRGTGAEAQGAAERTGVQPVGRDAGAVWLLRQLSARRVCRVRRGRCKAGSGTGKDFGGSTGRKRCTANPA